MTPAIAAEPGRLDEILRQHRVVPVLTVSGAGPGRRLGAALVRGGLPLAEVTLRVDGALDALAAMAADEDLVVGAGSVTTCAQVDAVVEAGAAFVVSPGLAEDVVQRCRAHDIAVLPGVATASEVMHALDQGIRTLKLFPVNLLGGPAGVRALSAPFPGVSFVPTGGVGPGQLSEYLSHSAVTAVGGSWLAPPDLVAQDRWDEIEIRVRHAVELARAVPVKET